jgi:hypothetical protein
MDLVLSIGGIVSSINLLSNAGQDERLGSDSPLNEVGAWRR